MAAVLVGAADPEIVALEARLRAAQLGADVAALDHLIADELLFTGPDGQLGTKAQDLAAHGSGAVRVRAHEPEELRVRRVGPDAAVAALLTRLAVDVGGTRVEGRYRYTRVWAREGGAPWRVVGGQVSAVAAPAPPPVDLATFLAARGFVAVPLEVNAVGHFELSAEVNGQPARMLLDTGASHTVFATPSAARLGLRTAPAAERAGGVGSSDHATETATVEALRLGALELRGVAAWTFDLSHVNRALVARGGAEVDGAVGGDLLRPAEAVIDYARATLYLRARGDA
jgi:clan AA aspartic protease (TIGR02281 family)